jgi:hypothetical protein
MLKKMKMRKLFGLTMLVGVMMTTSSCGIGFLVRGVIKGSLSTEKGSVPEDFIGKDETLLIMLWGSESYDKYVKKAFDKFYTGKKEYISFDELQKERYQNIEKYPYIFSQGPGNPRMYNGEAYSYSATGSRPFHVYERSTRKAYRGTVTSGMYYRVMQAYAMKLNEYRK